MKTLTFVVLLGLAAIAGAAPEAWNVAAVLGRKDVPLAADRAASGEATVTITRPQGDAFDIVVKLVIRPEAA